MVDENISIKADYFHAFRCCLFSLINESSSSVISGHCNKSSLTFFADEKASSSNGQIRISTSSALKVSGKVTVNRLPLRLSGFFLSLPLLLV